MRALPVLCAVAAVAAACVAFTAPEPDTRAVIEEVLIENELIDAADDYEDAPGRPFYVAHTRFCAWTATDPEDAQCMTIPGAEYGSADECQAAEWASISEMGARARSIGRRVAATVSCLAEYEA